MANIVDPIKNGKPRLVRMPQKKAIAGICAGLSYYFGCPTWIVRVALIVSIFAIGISPLAYIILWIFMPVASEIPSDYDDRTT